MMLNLKLTNPAHSSDKKDEFFCNDFPSKFLGDVKQLNIIVGANNSRKSRFMRSIIGIDHKILIEANVDINTNMGQAKDLIEKIRHYSEFFQSGLIQFDQSYSQDHESNLVFKFFEREARFQKIVISKDIERIITEICEGYLHANDNSKIEEINNSLETLHILARAIIYLYSHFKNNGYKAVDKLSYPNGQFKTLLENMPGKYSNEPLTYIDEMLDLFSCLENWSSHYGSVKIKKYTRDNIYIPALRTSRQLAGAGSGMNTNDFFEKTIRENYFPKDGNRIKIDTGLKLYEHINYARNGSRDEIRNFHAFEKFIGEAFFESDDIHIIPFRGKGSETDLIKISIPGELENIPIHNLGEGVQAIINLLFPIFTAADGQWIYIDEPENHLHPGFQNIFIQAITQNEVLKKKNLRYFINTHSNHILSESFLSGNDNAIFVFSKRNESSSNIFHFAQNEYQTLELLGVMNTSVLITNCSVWVEGITDRFYLRAFLYAYCNQLPSGEYKPSEGFDYSFIEYGGKNLTHFDFDSNKNENIGAYFINTNVFLIADNDMDKTRKAKYEKINRKNFHYEQTDLPEIENIIPEKILKDFLVNEIECDHDSVKSIFPLRKSNRKLGELFNGVTKRGKKVVIQAKNGGTLSYDYKLKLSQFVHRQIIAGVYEWDNLSESAPLKRIIQELYCFIKSKGRDKT